MNTPRRKSREQARAWGNCEGDQKKFADCFSSTTSQEFTWQPRFYSRGLFSTSPGTSVLDAGHPRIHDYFDVQIVNTYNEKSGRIFPMVGLSLSLSLSTVIMQQTIKIGKTRLGPFYYHNGSLKYEGGHTCRQYAVGLKTFESV